jgi:hypothetical protein
MALIKCRECETQISTSALTCPKCGASMEVATGKVDILKVVAAIAVLAIFGNYLWSQYGPLLGDYRLRQGHFACPTENAIIQVRGAGILGGSLTKAFVAARSGCVAGPKEFRMTRHTLGGVSEVRLASHLRRDRDGVAS